MSRSLPKEQTDFLGDENNIAYLARISGKSDARVITFFELFEINDEFQAYQNLIERLLGNLRNTIVERIFSSLRCYQQALAFALKFQDSQLKETTGAGPKNNPVRALRERPIAVSLIMYRRQNDTNNDALEMAEQTDV